MIGKITAPVIIIGMHRSGTSMMTRMLEEMGLFMGSELEDNHEAVFFLELNEWILRTCGGSWDNPEAINHLLQDKQLFDLTVDYLRHQLTSLRGLKYLGVRKFLKYKSPFNLTVPWGWKDPRMSFTLPLWLELFPDAKIIHIKRHGVDVAESLRVRSQGALDKASDIHEKRKRLDFLYNKKGGFIDSPACLKLPEGIKLWDRYVDIADQYVSTNADRAICVNYECFLENPYDTMQKLRNFCDLDVTDNKIQTMTSMIKSDRAYAYKEKSDLCELARIPEIKVHLEKHGYSV